MMPRIRPHTWAITGVVLLGLLFVTPSRLLAQSVVHVLFDDRSGCDPWSPQTCTVARLLSATVDGGGARITASSVVPRVANLRRLYATPDGTTLAWLGYTDATGYALYVHDLARQQTRMLPVGGTTPGEFVGNPAMPEAYLVGPTGITAYGAAGSRRFADRVCSNPREVSVSPDGRRLAVSCGAINRPPETAVLDIMTGQELALVPLSFGQLNADGSEYVGTSITGELQRWDTATGRAVATGPTGVGQVLLDVTGLVFTHGSNFLRQHDPQTLATVWSGVIPHGVSSPPLLDGRNGIIYTFGGGFAVFDIGTRRVRVQAPANAGSQVAFALAPLPSAPGPLAATVQGANVSLLWSPVAAAATTTRYVLEVGSAPGLNDIFSGLDVGLQTSFGASNVPPGTYYVRVRAGNYCGLGAPSNEVVVQVP